MLLKIYLKIIHYNLDDMPFHNKMQYNNLLFFLNKNSVHHQYRKETPNYSCSKFEKKKKKKKFIAFYIYLPKIVADIDNAHRQL